MRKRLLLLAAAVLPLAGCTDSPLALEPTPAPPAVTMPAVRASCEEDSDGSGATPFQIADDGCSTGSATFQWPFFGPVNDKLYEAPYDPSPGAAGLWLGSSVTPSSCFADHNPYIADADHDWMADHCELELARGFAPTMKFSRKEGCPDGEPHWAVKYFTSGHVRIAYMPAYYKDCGPNGVPLGIVGGGHTGDSEFIMVEVVFDQATRHWKFNGMWLSAHAGTMGDRSDWVGPGATQFTHRPLTHPTVWVAIEKHANYESRETCNKTVIGDECDWSFLDPLRFPILPHRNVGSRWVDLRGCVPSEKRYADSGRTECFYQSRKFNGWISYVIGDSSTPYRDHLMSIRFESRCAGYAQPSPLCLLYGTPIDGGPGPLPPV